SGEPLTHSLIDRDASTARHLTPTACLSEASSSLKRVEKETFQYGAGSVSLPSMATEKAETDRVPVTLARSTISYLEKLVRQGPHGTSVPGVARTLIEEGIRLAIKDGLLAIRDNGKPS